MTRILAVDPGNILSAYVVLEGAEIVHHEKLSNLDLIQRLRRAVPDGPLVVEMIAPYGKPVGRTVFDTCVWIGRFLEAWPGPSRMIERQEVKWHLCGRRRGLKDSDVRAALIARWGGKERAIGTSKAPGPLHGVKADEWAALAVAVTWRDKHARAFDAVQEAP